MIPLAMRRYKREEHGQLVREKLWGDKRLSLVREC